MNICKICQLSSPSGCAKLSGESCLKDALKLIKASATNGNVIKALFPNIEKDRERLIQEYGSQALYDTYEKWCSLPYKVGDTE